MFGPYMCSGFSVPSAGLRLRRTMPMMKEGRCEDVWWKGSCRPPASLCVPLLLTTMHIINQLRVGLRCKYPNESSFITWLNGPDNGPNEEINNSVIVTLLILIRPSCSVWFQHREGHFLNCALCVSTVYFHIYFIFSCFLCLKNLNLKVADVIFFLTVRLDNFLFCRFTPSRHVPNI